MPRRLLQLLLELLERAVRVFAQQEHAVGIVHVGRIGVTAGQFLERRARGPGQPGRLVVGAAPRKQHHLATVRRQLRWQQRHPQRRQAKRLDDSRGIVTFLRERLKVQERKLVLLEPRHDDGGVIAHRRHQLLAFYAPVAGLLQVRKRDLVVLDLELAQPLHAVDTAVADRLASGLGLLCGNHASEGISGLGIAIQPVVQGPDVPVAFVPRRAQLEGLFIEPQRLVDPVGLARRSGLARQTVELRAPGRLRLGRRGRLGRRRRARRLGWWRLGVAASRQAQHQGHHRPCRRALHTLVHHLSDDGGRGVVGSGAAPPGGLVCSRSWRCWRSRSAMALSRSPSSLRFSR